MDRKGKIAFLFDAFMLSLMHLLLTWFTLYFGAWMRDPMPKVQSGYLGLFTLAPALVLTLTIILMFVLRNFQGTHAKLKLFLVIVKYPILYLGILLNCLTVFLIPYFSFYSFEFIFTAIYTVILIFMTVVLPAFEIRRIRSEGM